MKQTDRMLSVNAMINGDVPNAIQGRIMPASSFRLFFLMRSELFSEVRKRSTQMEETAWERIVASAAPFTPIFRPNIKTGSRMMLQTAPISTVYMLVLA